MRLTLKLAFVLAAFSVALLPAGGEAATKIFTSADVGNSTGQAITGYYGQRKLVRDADGYWYAVVGNLNGAKYEVVMKKSTNTAGTAWSSKTVLCGSGGIIYNSTSYNFRFPSIDIDRKNGKIHLVFQLDNDILYYSKLVSLSGWTSAANWKNLQESATGYQQLVSATDCFYETSSLPRYGHGIALDSSGNPHIAYSRKPTSGSSYYKPYYFYGSTSGGWNSELNLNSADVDQRFPAIEVDSNDRVHYLVQYTTKTVHSYYSDNYTSFTGPSTLFNSASYDLFGITMAADSNGKVHVATRESISGSDTDIWTAYYDGSSWSATVDMDTYSAGWIDLGARMGSGLTSHVLIANAIYAVDTAQRLYRWGWTGSAWGQPETDTGLDQDYGHSMEKNAPAGTTDIGFIYYDNEGEGTGADCVWFDRLTNLSRQPLVAYTESSANTDIIRYRSFDGADWGSEASAYDTNDAGALKWHVAVTSPDGLKQAVVAVGSGSNTLYASLYDGSSWTTTSLGTVATSTYRCFAAAYEQQSGQLLIAAATTTNQQIKYWVHDGSSWVVDGSTYTFTSEFYSDKFNFLRMDARPDSNQIALIALNNSKHVGALIWDGEANSWGNEKKLSQTAIPSANNLCPVDVKYMRAGPYKGRAVFVWPNNSTTLYSWTWNGSSWESAEKTKTGMGSTSILWVELAADPNSSRLLAASADGNEDLYTVDWTGSSWGTARSIETDLLYTAWYGRRYAVSFESGTGHSGHAIIAYSDSTNLRYQHTSDITGAWGAETSIDASYDCNWVELARDTVHTIHLICQEEDGPDDLVAYAWNNTSWTSEGILETDLQYDSNGSYEAFAVTTGRAASSTPAVTGSGPMIGFANNGDSQMRFSLWDGSDFSEAATGPTFATPLDWVVVEPCATGKMMVGATNGGALYASFFDGSAWGPVKTLQASGGNTNRFFDAAVETNSGQILIVAGSGSDLYYWVYDKGVWVVDGSTISLSLGSRTKNFLELASDPNSNEIAMVVVDSFSDARGVIWDGDNNTWGNEVVLEASLSTSSYQPVGVCYIATGTGAGKAMFVWGSGSNMESRIWNGSSWDTELTAVAIGGGANWVRLKADPNSNKLVFGAQRSNYTCVVVIWDGSAWGSATTVESALFGNLNGYPAFDVIFENASGHESDILVVYSDSSNLRYQHVDWNVSSYSWGSESDVHATYDLYWAQLQHADNGQILLVTREAIVNIQSLKTFSWNNTSFTEEKTLTYDMTSSSQSHLPLFLSPTYSTSGASVGLTQAHYRWRNDNGSESAATFALAEDSKMGIAKETTKRLRFLVKNTGIITASAFQLQVAETATCSSGTYTAVGGGTGAGAHWAAAASSYLTDAAATTNVSSGLTDPDSMSFLSGQVKESSVTAATLNIDTNEFVELEFSIQATASATASGDYCFRLYDANQLATLYAYTNYGQARVLGVTAVKLLEFAAQGAGEAVEVFWQTGQEVKNKGFDLYRAESLTGAWVKLNAGLIPSASESGEGRSYRFVDEQAQRGRIYYYRLEDVDLTDTHTPHGPICVDWDADGLPDDWEIANGLNPLVNDFALDADRDGSSNGQEYHRGTDPFNRDSDGDGIADGAEQKGPSTGAAPGALGPGVEAIASGPEELVLDLSTVSFDAGRVTAEGQEFERLSIAHYVHGYTRTTGRPELPVKGVLVEVPEGKTARLTVLAEDKQLLPGYRVYPVPAKLPGEAGELLESFALDEAAYAAAELHPARPAELSTAYVYRGKTQQRVLFYPLRFNAATGELTFSRRIRVRIEFVEMPAAAAASLSAHRSALSAFSPGPGVAYKLSVSSEGIHRVTRDYLLGQGIAASDIDALDLATVRLYHLGQEQAIRVHDAGGDDRLDAGDYIAFYATAVPADYAKYAKYNVYWLADPGSPGALRMGSVEGSPAGGALAASHTATVHHELNQGYLQAAPGPDGMERWIFFSVALGSGISSAEAGLPRSFTLSLPGATGPGDLTIRMYGPYEMDHEAAVTLNGSPLGSATWSGIAYTEAEFPDVSFSAGDNTVAVTCESGEDRTAFDWFKAVYERDFTASGGSLKFTHAGGYRYRVTGFATSDIEVFDVSDPAAVKRVVNGTLTGAGPYALEIEPAGAAGEKSYLAVAAAGLLTPAAAVKDTPSALQSGTNAADWILITHRDIGWENGAERNWVTQLVALRQSQGLRTIVVDVADIYDEFGYGLQTPQAIREFLTQAFTNWQSPAPRYVLLAGDTTYDFLDHRALGTVNHVPGYLIHTAYLGETVTDDWYGRVSGEDALCDLAIGRLPAGSPAQAEAMVAKIIAYESAVNTKTWQKQTLFVTDNQEENWEGIFEVMAEEGVARLSAGLANPQRFYLQEYENELLSVSDLTADLLNSINAGALMLHYSGHANVNIWGTEKLLDNSNSGGSPRQDVNGLANEGYYPFVVNMACLSGYFIYPSLGAYSAQSWVSLAEGFLRPQTKGAVAALMPSGMTETNGQRVLSNALMDAIFAEDRRRLGDAVAAAKQALLANAEDGYQEVADTFLLFGDPATELKVPLPRRPQGLAAEVQGGGVLLSWNAALDCNANPVSGYHVYRRAGGEASYSRLTSSPIAALTYTDLTATAPSAAALSAAVTYTYAVCAVDAEGDASALSAPAAVTIAGEDAGGAEAASSGGGGGCFVTTAAGPSEHAATLWLVLSVVAGLMGLSRRYSKSGYNPSHRRSPETALKWASYVTRTEPVSMA